MRDDDALLRRCASLAVLIERRGSLVVLPDAEPCPLDSPTHGRDRARACRQ